MFLIFELRLRFPSNRRQLIFFSHNGNMMNHTDNRRDAIAQESGRAPHNTSIVEFTTRPSSNSILLHSIRDTGLEDIYNITHNISTCKATCMATCKMRGLRSLLRIMIELWINYAE